MASANLLRLGRIVLAVIAVGLPVRSAVSTYIPDLTAPGQGPLFTDAITYLAAGERLNAGHELYVLQPGDRIPTSRVDDMSTAPLLSPPTIAVLWRPLAALPFGMALWVIALWTALLGAVAVLAYRHVAGFILAVALADAIAQALVIGNLYAFFPAAMIVAWRATSGGVIATLSALKITPGTLIGWMPTRAWRGFAVTAAALAAVTIVGAGWSSAVAYIPIALGVHGSPLSLSGLSGYAWLTPSVLVAGTLLAAATRRLSAVSFSIAVLASVFGSPSVFVGHLAVLVALAIPVAFPRAEDRP